MPPRKAETTLTFTRKTEKIHSVVYGANTKDGNPFTIYIPKEVLTLLGNPTSVLVTFKAS